VNYFNNYCTSNYYALGLISLIAIIIVSSLVAVLVWDRRRNRREEEKSNFPKKKREYLQISRMSSGERYGRMISVSSSAIGAGCMSGM
jgi:hypothetical protein